ncbi:NAD(P)/FAD-dependent oxidoreductase [Aceticella autotrophica]|uniref:NAD(P)/FAD-dependent oxidoreductase n=1 Tax=Aceticella autotrophica TaxID=2755338 RepID=A0A975AW87_9THEO|nr:NAD(P)/FAD-dependent oxidoreductase [Aceticella autotrophica]QSZ27631.1 NAD(P)/FAD-dependent oxidoreductase [Aceticella autotrophica]
MKDLLEKGAIIQRDGETYAIAPHTPGGLVTPEILRKVADIAEKYGAKAIKLTSAERIALVGLQEKDLDNIWKELDMKPGHAIGICVRSIKFCPGTTFCKRGKQDSVSLGLELDKLYHGMDMPGKMKIGVSGCINSCAESTIKDIGLIGKANGWTLLVGGCATGAHTRIADVLAENLTTEEAKALIAKVIEYYKANAKSKRLSRYIEEIGIEEFKKAVLK